MTISIKKRVYSFWSRQGPWSIGRIAIHTNYEPHILLCIKWWFTGANPIGDDFWKDWGTINFGVCVFGFWVQVRYAYGSKTSVLTRWMTP